MSFAMTREEREAFLADLHVGVLSLEDAARGPLSAPIWYDYEPGGEVWFITGKGSRKGRLLARGARVSLVAQTEDAPYRYVSVEGPIVSIEPAELEKHTRPMARRYLGREGGDRYVEAMSGQTEASIVVRVHPERWLTVDYGKRASP